MGWITMELWTLEVDWFPSEEASLRLGLGYEPFRFIFLNQPSKNDFLAIATTIDWTTGWSALPAIAENQWPVVLPGRMSASTDLIVGYEIRGKLRVSKSSVFVNEQQPA
jgi:hypothetical protein